MAQRKKIAAKPVSGGSSKKRKQKNPTQKTERQRVKVMGPSGKLRLEWRDW